MNNKFTAVLFLLPLLAGIITCETGRNIKLPPELKNQKMECGIYIPDFPSPFNYEKITKTSAIPVTANSRYALLKTDELFIELDRDDLRRIFVKNIFADLKPLNGSAGISLTGGIFNRLDIEKVTYKEDELRNNPRLSGYDFGKIRNSLTARYLLEIYLFQWGHLRSDSSYSYFTGVATIYDTTDSSVVWKHFFDDRSPITETGAAGVGADNIKKDAIMASIDSCIKKITGSIKDAMRNESAD